MPRRFRRVSPHGSSSALPKKKKKFPLPGKGDLKHIYKKYVAPTAASRIAALHEALIWWDTAVPAMLQRQGKPMTADQTKLFGVANKCRTRGVSPGTPEPEAETSLCMAIKKIEAMFPDALFPKLQTYIDEYTANKKILEQKAAEWQARFQAIIDPLNQAFSAVGLSFEVQKSDVERQWDGGSKILLSTRLAKVLWRKYREEGLLPVMLSEAHYALTISGVKLVDDGNGNMIPRPDLAVSVNNMPKLHESILKICASMPPKKLFRGFSGSVQASAGQPTPVLRKQKTTSSSGGTSTPKVHKVHTSRKGGLVGGRYTPGSAMADMFLLLADEKPHARDGVFKEISAKGCANPLDRFKWLVKHGDRDGKWKILQQGNVIQMEIKDNSVRP